MLASLRQRNPSSLGLASAVGEAEAQQAIGVESSSSTASTPPRTPPDDQNQHNPRSRCRTSETSIIPPMRSRIWSQSLRAPTSDAGVSSAAACNSHDAGWNSYTTVRENVPKPTLSSLVLCEWKTLSGCIGAGGDGRICLNSVFLLAKGISLAIVLGALLVDVYLLKTAVFMEAESVELASNGAARATSEGVPQHGALRRRRSPRPRYALPLVATHHALTNLGLPAESSSTLHGTVKPIGYSVGNNDNLDTGTSKSGEARTSSGGNSYDRAKPAVRSSEHERRDTVDTKIKRKYSRWEDERQQRHEHETKDAFSSLQAGQSRHTPAVGPVDRDTGAVATPALMPVPELYDGQRIAVLVPYIGSDLPVWWDAFAEQAGHNEGLVDWIIICDQKLVREGGPPNIKFFPMETERLSWLLAGVVEHQHPDLVQKNGHVTPFGGDNKHQRRSAMEAKLVSERETPSADKTWEDLVGDGTKEALERTIGARRRIASFLTKVLVMSPYYLVEFKPALGWLFREYLMEYTHWAYGDLDVLFGDMRRGWLEPNELQDFDIITFSFGDQYRAYLRGQLTIHKNNIAVNRIWAGCDHLIHYTQRLEKLLENRALPLESAEGCYSLAAASDTSLKIKFSVKALSDIDEEGGYNRELQVILDGKGLVTLCPDLGYYFGDSGEYDAGRVSYETKDLEGGIQIMQDPVGPVSPVRRADSSEKRCEHWIKSEYQTCVEGVGGSHTLFLIGGQYLAQGFVNTKAATGGRNCRAGAFYHFQDHKVNYRSWNTRPPVPGAHSGIAAGSAGIVPLPVAGWRERASDPTLRAPPPPTKYKHTYCLEWVERRRVRRPHKGRPELVCVQKVPGSEAVTLVDTRTARSLPRAARLSATATTATVTLGGVGRPGDLGPFLLDAWQWEGPKIFAMVLASDELAPMENLIKMGGVAGTSGDGVLVVGLVRPPFPQEPLRKQRPAGLPQKALMNLVSDFCESRYLLTLPGPASLSHNAYTSILNQLPPHAPSKTSTASRQQDDGPVTLVVPYEFLPYSPSSTGGTTVSTPPVQEYHASRRPPPRAAAGLTATASAANALNSKPLGHDGQITRAPAPPPPVGGAARTATAAASASKASQAAAAAGQAAVGAAISAREAAQVVAAAGAPVDAAFSAALRAAALATAAGEAASNAAESARKAVDAAKKAEASALVAAAAVTRAEARTEAAVGQEQATQKAAGMQTTVQATTEPSLVEGNQHNNVAPTAVAAHEPSGIHIGRDSADHGTTARNEVGDTAVGGGEFVQESSLLREKTEANLSTDTLSIRERKPPSVLAPPNAAALNATTTSDRGDRQEQQKSPNLNPDGGNKSELKPGTNDAEEEYPQQSQPVQVSPEQHNREREMIQGVPAAADTLQARRQLGSQPRGPATAVASMITRRDEWDEERAEERWLKTLLTSGADMVGLVVDLWTPGPLFMRQIEEFGDAGCLDGAYALGLWHAGSSFRVATDVTISPTKLPISRQSERGRAGTQGAGSGRRLSDLSSAEDTCVPGQGTVKTAAIYSAFLRQVSNVYRHPRSGSTETFFGHTSGESETDSGVGGHSNKSYTQSTATRRTGGGKREGGTRPRLREGERIIKGGRPAIARDPFVFTFSEHPEISHSDGMADDVLPEIGGGRARKGGWEGAWEDYFPS